MLKNFLFFALSCILLCASAFADDARFLQVTGKIKNSSVTFSFDDIKKMKRAEIVTATQWTPRTSFVGVEIRTILDAVKADPAATTITVYALDGYVTTIPIADVRKWPIILAYQADGKRMTVATKGPLWVVYPLDTYPETKTSLNYGRMAWATVKLSIQ